MNWWQELPYHISPYLIQINGFGIRYYSLMYLAAFVSVYLVVRYRLSRESFPYSPELIQDFLTWAALGVILGGRMGYVLFYNFSYFISHPLEILLPFEFSNGIRFTGITGMSFHGGLIGVVLVFILFCRSRSINIWTFSDLFCPVVPLGYTFGRLGNFLNGELFGTVTTRPWGMVFPGDPLHLLRHPSQLYEAFFEGLVLFILLWAVRQKSWAHHRLFALYLTGYGFFRFFIEFIRQPDAHLNTIWLGLTMGQLLCGAMILVGGILFFRPGAGEKRSS